MPPLTFRDYHMRKLSRARIVVHATSALVLALALAAGSTGPALALALSDFFSYSYTAQFSKTDVAAGESFSVTVVGQGVCTKDLPLAPSDAVITGRIVAQNQATSARVTLNPSYTLTLSPVPSRLGQTAQASTVVPLQFPAGSPPGAYVILGELIKAEVRVIIPLDVTNVFPASQTLGTVTVLGGGGGGGGGAPGGGQATPTPVPAVPNPVVAVGDISRFLDDSVFTVAVVVRSDDSKSTLAIKSGVRATGPGGAEITSLDMAVDKAAPEPPRNAAFASALYRLGPNGTTFSPAVTLTIAYDRQRIPVVGSDEKTLVIAYRNDGTGGWTNLPSTVDAERQTVSAAVSHFTQFAVLTSLPVTAPAPTVTPSPAPVVSPAPAPKPTATIAPPPKTTAAPVPTPAPPPETPPTPAPAPMPPQPPPANPWLTAGVVAAAVVVVGVVLAILRRKKRQQT